MKPITPERRAEIELFIKVKRFNGDELAAQAMQELLDDSAYWRNAVKKAHAIEQDHDGANCNFCAANSYGFALTHSPDCPWLLAQQP